MTRIQNPNLEILVMAVDQLGKLADEMVFLGGCATGLLITDMAAPPIRATRDVDAIVQVASLTDYHQLSARLREQGFKEDMSDNAPICRWLADNVILDVMPTDSSILGFGNKWYSQAMEHAESVTLPTGRSIRMVSAPYFLITKLEAFDGRGGGDYLLSHDIEDIIAVLDGRPEITEEIKQADPVLLSALAENFSKKLRDSRFTDAISGHMPADDVGQERVRNIVVIIREIAEAAK